jgi:hypothetical protein
LCKKENTGNTIGVRTNVHRELPSRVRRICPKPPVVTPNKALLERKRNEVARFATTTKKTTPIGFPLIFPSP